jgi:hypothetical protein
MELRLPRLRWQWRSSMSYYCFNPNCDLWGDAQPCVLLACSPPIVASVCKGCEGELIFHDNWDRDERTHDDGTPVTA